MVILNFFFVAMMLGATAAGFQLWKRFVTNLRLDGPGLPVQPVVPSPLGLVDLAILVAFFLGGQIVAVVLAMTVFGINVESMESLAGGDASTLMFVIGTLQWLTIAAAVTLLTIRYGNARCVGIDASQMVTDVGLGVAAFVMLLPLVMLVQWLLSLIWPYEHPTLDMVANDGSLWPILSAWFIAVIVAPVTEEIMFRGGLQNWFQRAMDPGVPMIAKLLGGPDRLFGNIAAQPSLPQEVDVLSTEHSLEEPGLETEPASLPPTLPIPTRPMSPWQYWLPVAASALIFALAHFGQGAAPIPLFLFALALGYLYRRTGRITPCIIAHVALNGFSMFWFTVQLMAGDGEVVPDEAVPELLPTGWLQWLLG